MGEISDIGFGTLQHTSENVLRGETRNAANVCVSNAIAALPIFRPYDLGGAIHSRSDGQKFETALPTIGARYSPKYFGLGKGVVTDTLLANHVPVNGALIGAHAHASRSVFDLLFNNTTDIQPTIHSTDTHGTNQVTSLSCPSSATSLRHAPKRYARRFARRCTVFSIRARMVS